MPSPPDQQSLALPPLADQVTRLVALGLHTAAGLGEADLERAASAAASPGLLVVHPARLAASALAPHLRLGDRSGFVVEDLTDVDNFQPTVALPDSPAYVAVDPARGDELAGWTPAEALPELAGSRRSPMTLTEGLHWAVQQPEVLERNHCFMTIGSRLQRPDGSYDARTPALWISNGTGRDGRGRRGAPKVGWCWWNNRHSWLGFASVSDRV